MKILQTILVGGLLALPFQGTAQTAPAKNYKGLTNGNPISSNVFCADPTALDYEGRLYVYGSNDSQQFIANNKSGSNGYGAIRSIVVFSTDDMVNWTFHGTIDVKKVCSWSGNSWAPSVTWRTNDNGKDEFFLYFANGASNVGVLKADSPIGPFKSPRSNAIVNHGMAGVDPCNWLFDPGVVVTDNGEAWLSFGGGDPNNQGNDMLPGNARIAKLKKNMTELDGTAYNLPAPYHFEASELNIIDGKFVYTYCSSFKNRNNNDWNKYKSQKNITIGAPNTGTMCYMVTDDPTNPDSWVYKGVYGPHPGTSGNNHSHLHKYQGTYYHIYHSGALEKSMNTGASGFRSICINKATVNESKQTINSVTLNNTGVSAIKNFDPYLKQQAETMANSGGVNYEDFTNTVKVESINTNKNDASENLQVKMKAGAWTMVRLADFGDEGARSFTVRVRGNGKMELRWQMTGAAIATVEYNYKGWKEYTISVDPTVFKGLHNYLYFVFPDADESTYFDWWQFSKDDPTAVSTITHETNTDGPAYDLSGRRIDKGSKQRGIYIQNGKKAVVK